jgi:hypothetical protein
MSQSSTFPHAGPSGAAERTGVRRRDWFALLLLGQGVYYLVTGVWPLLSIATFQMVTGDKTDLWLVKTVAVLIVVVAVTLLFAAWRGRKPPEAAVLAVGSALGLTAIDVIYVARGVIDPIYLADAAAEIVLIAAWGIVLLRDYRLRPAEGTAPAA